MIRKAHVLIVNLILLTTKLVLLIALVFEQRAEMSRKSKTFARLCYSTPTVPGRSRSNVARIGVTEKYGARQVLGRADYASWSTLPINHPNVNFRGHTRGVERPVEGGLALD
jgi:hypothetical protein